MGCRFIVGLFGSWVLGLLGRGFLGVLWIVGFLGCWVAGLSDRWVVGLLFLAGCVVGLLGWRVACLFGVVLLGCWVGGSSNGRGQDDSSGTRQTPNSLFFCPCLW